MGKYTIDGSKEFEARITSQLNDITNEILNQIPKRDIYAITLSGGYGRGEGGIIIDNNQENCYNDYDLFVVVNNISRKKKLAYQKRMQIIHDKFTPLFGIHVDVGPLKTINAVKKAPFWMMWYEMKHGLITMWGNDNVTSLFPNYNPKLMPKMEALRLLLNRATGLLLCKKHFDSFENNESKEFILRNIRKAQLAMGDAFLIQKHKFHFSYIERFNRFMLQEDKIVKELNLKTTYKLAHEFKLHPYRATNDKKLYLDEYNQTLEDFATVYNWIFTGKISSHINFNAYYDSLVLVFKNQSNFLENIKNIIKNLKNINVVKSEYIYFNPRYTLFLALPYLLFNTESTKIFNVFKTDDKEIIYNSFINLWEVNN